MRRRYEGRYTPYAGATRPIPNYDGFRITEDGNVFSCLTDFPKLLKQCNSSVYPSVWIQSKKQPVNIHRLLALAWLDGYFEDAQCDHINRDKFDYRLNNLRWVTVKENAANRDNSKVIEFNNSRKGIKAKPDHIEKRRLGLLKSYENDTTRREAARQRFLDNNPTKPGKDHHMYGVPRELNTCPHCGTVGGNGPMQRWHFDKCKHKEIVQF